MNKNEHRTTTKEMFILKERFDAIKSVNTKQS